MRQILAALLLFFICGGASGQSAEGRYSSRMTQDGVLFFIMPERLKDVDGIKRFEYDMTMLSWTDSITVNFTFESASMLLPENLEIRYDGGSVACDSYSPLFVDIKKNHYEIRITSRFSAPDIEKILQSATSPRFCFRQGGVEKSAGYKPRTWIKDRKRLNDIFKLYLYSKK